MLALSRGCHSRIVVADTGGRLITGGRRATRGQKVRWARGRRVTRQSLREIRRCCVRVETPRAQRVSIYILVKKKVGKGIHTF